MAQHYTTRFATRDLFQIVLQVNTDAAESGCTFFITLVLINQLVPDLLGSFGDDDNTKIRPTQIALADLFRDCLGRKGNLRNQDHVSAARDTGVKCDPTG